MDAGDSDFSSNRFTVGLSQVGLRVNSFPFTPCAFPFNLLNDFAKCVS